MPALENQRHEAFAQALAKGSSATDAYVTAGYKPSRTAASRLSSKVNIQLRVKELLTRAADRAEIDIARTLKELVRVGTSDVRRFFDQNGKLKAVHELDDETAAAVASVEVVTKTIPGDNEEGGHVEYLHKVRLWDKNSALEKIAKHLGMFIDRVEHGGPNGGPVQIAAIDAGKLSDAALRELLSVRRNQAD